MNMFVEGAATPREREQLLAHLAACAECREMVFLLKGEEADKAAAPEPVVRPWRRWFMPLGLAGAALACGIAALVYLRPHGPTTQPAPEMATVTAPNAENGTGQATSHSATPARESRPSVARRATKPVAKAEGVAGGAVGGMFSMRQATPVAPNAGAVTTPVPSAGPLPTTATNGAVAGVGAAPGKDAQQTAVNASANKPLAPTISGRSTTNLMNFNRLPSLQIEHDRGPDDGLSEISGRVTDATGAVIAGAALVLRDAEGKTRSAATGADGKFRLTGVAAGDYSLSVTAPGFERAQQAISLKPRDLAMLDSVLKVGSETQTVAVVAESPALQTSQAEVSATQIGITPALPSRLPATARVSIGKRALSMDTAGSLFLSRNGGRSWKKLKPVWVGKVVGIALAEHEASSGANTPELKRKAEPATAAKAPTAFQITTDSGAVWVSNDGAHWRVR
jgi:hypothetical protein